MNNQVEILVKAWKVLEILTVSLDRIGTIETKDVIKGHHALVEFFSPELSQKIAEARTALVELLKEHDPNISSLLETLADNEEDMGYWRG